MSLCRGHVACKELRAFPLFRRVKFHAHRFTLLWTKLHVRCYIEHAHRRRCNSWFWTLCLFPTGGLCVCPPVLQGKQAWLLGVRMFLREVRMLERNQNAWLVHLFRPSFSFDFLHTKMKQFNCDISTCQVSISFPLGPNYSDTSHQRKSGLLFHSFFSPHQQNQILIKWPKTKCFGLLRWLTTNKINFL